MSQAAYGAQRVAEMKERKRLSDKHTYRGHPLFQPRCPLCIAKQNSNAAMYASALANIFNPLPAGHVPRGFRKDQLPTTYPEPQDERSMERAARRVFK